ncbi:MAG TPA: LamG-like jellyroll fold domain-containing protein [Chitinophagales bacterium]|nr:LamG-like jellyroll fold domain-containing protein [Chitinophagales bacterium]
MKQQFLPPFLAFLLFISFLSKAQISSTTLYFDGADDLVTVPANSVYNFGTGDFTLEAWIRDDVPASGYTQENIIRSDPEWNNGVWSSTLSLRIENGYLELFLKVGAFATADGQDLRDGQCHHVAAVVDRNINPPFYVTLYIDGNMVVWNQYWIEDTILNNINIGTALRLGGMHKGTFREIRMWNSARTQSQIQNTMNSVLSASEPNLISYWRMNDGSGTIVNDYSSTNNDGTLGSGTSSTKPVWAINCCSIICTTPAGLSASNITGTSAKLNWAVTNCAIGYKVRYKPSGASSWSAINPAGTKGSKKITGLTPGTGYVWQVRSKCASNPNAWSAWSDTQSFSTPLRIAQQEEMIFNAYPNPVADQLNISANNYEIDRIEITNLAGQVILVKNLVSEYTLPNIQLDVSSLSSGVYLLTAFANKVIMRKVFVKN